MKWIVYQLLQSTIEDGTILINKKVGYSDANLVIAESEAHNGEYAIEEDENVFDKKLPASLDANGKVEARQTSSAINVQTASYVLTIGDAGKLVAIQSETECTVKVPALAFPIGTEIEIVQMGEGTVTVAGDGVTLLSMDEMVATAGKYAVVCLKKLDASTWLLGGALA